MTSPLIPWFLALLLLADQLLQHLHRQLLTGIPAVETIAVVLHQEHQLVAVVREAQFDRRRETTQQRWQRVFSDVDEGERLLGFSHRDHTAGTLRCRFTGQTQGNNVAVGASIALNSATDTVSAEIDRDISTVGDIAIGAKSVAKSSASSSRAATATPSPSPPPSLFELPKFWIFSDISLSKFFI